MNKLHFLLMSLFVVNTLSAQYVYTIKADSVKITNHCDTAELIIENHTQNVLGFLYNKGRGRTEFRRVLKLNDSTLIFGGDTLSVRGNIQANNGLGIFGGKVQLGQPIGESGNPAQLLLNREVPLNGYELSFTNTSAGRSIGLKNSAISILGDTAKLTLIESALQKSLSLKTTPDYSVISTGTPLMYMYSEGGFLLNFDTTAPEDPGSHNALINGNLRISTEDTYVHPQGIWVESKTALSPYSGGQISIATSHETTSPGQRLGTLQFGLRKWGSFLDAITIAAYSQDALSEDHEAGQIRPSYLTFEMADPQTAVVQERMRITAEGYVGIGTNAPMSALQVKGSTLVTGDEANGVPGTLLISDYANIEKGISISRSPSGEYTQFTFGDIANNAQHIYFLDSRNIAIGNSIDNGKRFTVYGTGEFTDTLTATTMGNSDNSDRIATTAFVKNVLGTPALTVVSSGTSDFTATTGALIKLASLSGAGSHSVTLPSASTHSGHRIYLWNLNSSGNSWTFSSSVTLPDGTTSNTIANQTTIELISDGTVWIKWK